MEGFSRLKRSILFSWALYDLANQFFLLNIVSLYFPRWLIMEKACPDVFYSLAFGGSMLCVAVCAPFLGAIADIRGRHKGFLIFFTVLSVAGTMALGIPTGIGLSLFLFAAANFGCQGAMIFYNALMTKVASAERLGFVSGLGRMFGYSGAILAMYMTRPVLLRGGYRPAFLFSGILFLFFSLPCMILVKERDGGEKAGLVEGRVPLTGLIRRIRERIADRDTLNRLSGLLLAGFFAICAINTVMIFMSVYAGKVFGVGDSQMIDLIAFSTVFAIAGSLLSGIVSDRVGYRRTLLGVFTLWGICFLVGAFLEAPFHWLLGALIGLSLGGTWTVTRALIIKLVPEENIGMAFGIFNVVCYIAGIVGPLFWGVALLYLSRFGEAGYRIAFFSMGIFIGAGTILLMRVREEPRPTQCG